MGNDVAASVTEVKVYRRHNCERSHRTYSALARCMWPSADVSGEGPYATVASCRVRTVHLHATEAEAAAAKQRIDDSGCCGACIRRHEIVALVLAKK